MRTKSRTRSRKISEFCTSFAGSSTSDLTNYRKIERGMAAYKKNTGKTHPLYSGIKMSSKRKTGSISLIDLYSDFWYGTISIGTPPVDYTGMTFSSSQRLLSDMCRAQCSLTPGAVISLFPRTVADHPARGTKNITHLPAPPRKISGRLSRSSMEAAHMPPASNILMSLPLAAWLYVELCFSFLFLT